MSSETELQHKASYQINFQTPSLGKDIGTADQGCNPNHADIEAIVITPPTEAAPGHITGRVDTT